MLFRSAQRALDDYRKRNPKANSSTDEYLQKLETQAAQAQQNAQGGSRWAVMSPSARGAVLTHGRLQSEYANIRENTKRLAAEQKEAEAAAGKEVVGSNGLVYKTPNLYDDAKYFEQTGVLRGGAGLGTSVTPGGGVIRDAMLDDSDPKNALSKRVLESKYGSGSMIRLPDEALAKRPPATFDGKPAAVFFDDAARRQNRNIDVGGIRYSPDQYPTKLPTQPKGSNADKVMGDVPKIEAEDQRKAEDFVNAAPRTVNGYQIGRAHV